jgi:formylglycine-generating enzyme required for sulfatase activity
MPVNLNGLSVWPQHSTNGFYVQFGGEDFQSGAWNYYAGLGRADANGGFLWKIAFTNGFFSPTTTPGQYWALQDVQSGQGTTTCFGVYNHSGASIVPVLEKQLPFSNWRGVGVAVLNNGYIVLSLDNSNSVSLLAWNATGTLLWSKTLSSADFPDATPAGELRSVNIAQIGTNNILLSIAANEAIGLTSVMVRLDSAGTIQWSKKLITVPGSNYGISFPAIVTPSGDVFAIALDIDTGTFSIGTVISKITGNGIQSWGQKIVGAGFQGYPMPIDGQGGVLLNLSAGQKCVCCVIAAGGQVSPLVEVDVTSQTVSGLLIAQAVSLSAGKIYYAVVGGNTAANGIIGSSSLSFDNFVGKSSDTVQFLWESLTYLDDNRLAFVGRGADYTAVQLVMMDSNLVEESACGIFNNTATFATSVPSAYAVTNTPTLLTISVLSSNTPVVLNSTQLLFENFTFNETPLCLTPPSPYTYTTNNGTITITGYTGSGGAVTVPDAINGLPVTSIGDWAFESCTSLTSITIPNSVTSIGDLAFYSCTSLTAIAVATNNPVYSSADGVLFNKSQTTLIECPGGKAGSYTIPNSVTNIGEMAFDLCTSLTSITIPNSVTSIRDLAFESCTSLTSITIPNSVTSIGDWAFASCTSLARINFQGDAPSLGGSFVFSNNSNPIVYYLPGTKSWGTMFGGRPTAPWVLPNPLVLNSGLGIQTNRFGFIISWATNIPVVVEACTNLVNPIWSPVGTTTLTGGWSYFSDPQWTSFIRRFYRVVAYPTNSAPPSGMALIPARSFTMGDSLDGNLDATQHVVTVSAFQMDKCEVTYDLWLRVYQYAAANGYTFDNTGSGKGTYHPVQSINWYDAVKWCNARSETEGLTPCYYTDATLTTVYRTGRVDLANANVNWNANGYRLPTEAEWEKAGRGGLSGHRFPWGDVIAETRANYSANTLSFPYDFGPTGYNPIGVVGGLPYTSPVGSFAANNYGLYDMAGNVEEWCWDWYNNMYYNGSIGSTDPHGPLSSPSGSRVQRGGSWSTGASDLRCMKRNYVVPTIYNNGVGFRCVRSAP